MLCAGLQSALLPLPQLQHRTAAKVLQPAPPEACEVVIQELELRGTGLRWFRNWLVREIAALSYAGGQEQKKKAQELKEFKISVDN